ncbi:MAG: vWA domain-containing protein, partial [Planctomycetota bacterium]
MKKHNEQFENNISRLLKTGRESNMPSEEFTQNLVDDALTELKTDQDRRQKRSNVMKPRNFHFLEIAAGFAVCICLLGLVMVHLGSDIESKLEMIQSSTEGPVATQEQQPVLDLRGKSVQVALRNPSDDMSRSADRDPTVLNSASRYDGRQASGKISSVAKSDNMEVQVIRGSKAHDEEVIAGRRMAHGGTRPPNGEDVDAMFFENYGVNPFIDTEDDHLSTFAIDVDTGSYTVCRRYLQQGNLPPKEAVRVEEFVNYFKYDYEAPQEETFAVYTEAMPWSFGAERKNTHLMRIGLKAMEVADESRKPAVLTFVIDVSGSMNRENRLDLVKRSLEMLIDKLRPQDKIGIAVYGSRGRKVLDHTGLEDKAAILAAIRSLHSTGSTYAEEGIRIGYEMAEEAYIPSFINRVILCSDGVANVGNTGADKILEIIKDKADKGITLSSLGFGMGNYNDVLLERLGDKGNGYYAYIDTIDQARRLFSNLTGALQVVARDVKIQVDFNPDVVRSYRLIGYENRDVADKDFRNDTVDGGEIGAGHSTTALYELKLWPEKVGKVATTQIRYKNPETYEVTEIAADFGSDDIHANREVISPSFALTTVATEFAEILRESYWAKGASLEDTL